MMRTINLLVLCLITCSLVAQNSSVSYSNVIDVNNTGQGYLRPRLAINGDGMPVVLWGRSNPNANFVAVGNGMGFSTNVAVHIPGQVLPAVSDWMGSSIAAAGNTVWMVMKATPEDQWTIYVRRSDDGGYTWQDTVRVPPHNGLLSRFPSIAVSDPDRPIVQYMEFAEGFMGARYVTAKMEMGAFQAPVQVSSPFAQGNVCDCCPGQVVVDGDRAAALYRNAGNDERVMWGAYSIDAGASYPVGSMIDTTGWIISQCMSSGPDGLISGDSITYVWMSGGTTGQKAYLGRASMINGGIGYHDRVWSLDQSISQNYPRIAGTGDTLGVVWQQSSSGQMEVLFSWSTTGPDGMSVPDTLNVDLSGMQTTPDIAYADGAFHIIWGEMGANQVRYRKAVLENTVSVLETKPAQPEFTIWPNPVQDVLYLDPNNWLQAEIFDLKGRSLFRATITHGMVDVSKLAAGSYIVQLLDRNGTGRTERFEKQ